jgi:hypothetical protein
MPILYPALALRAVIEFSSLNLVFLVFERVNIGTFEIPQKNVKKGGRI